MEKRKLSIMLPADDLMRLKIESLERHTLESSIVLEALRLYWGQEVPPAAPRKPAATPRTPAEPRATKPRGKREGGDRELFAQIDAAIKEGKIGQAELMREVAPDINPANYRSSWASTGHVPERYIPAVRAVLERLDSSENH